MKQLLMTSIAIFGLAIISNAQVPNYVPSNGLVGWWPFNGNANDESLNGNNGTVNGATLTTDRLGNANSAYGFTGTTDNTEVITGSCSNFPSGNSPKTISVWYYANNILTQQQLLGYGGGGCGDSYIMNFNNINVPAGVYEIQGHCTNFQTHANIPTPYNGYWHNLILTHDGSVFKFYNDGVLVSTSSFQITNIIADSKIFCFGKETYTSGLTSYYQDNIQGFNGKLDDIGIWNRALTQQEITDLYNGCQLSISAQPNNQTININNNAQFVVVSSDPSSTFQWQTDLGVGFQNLNNVGQYSGTINDTLNVANVTLSNNNQPFRCIVSSGSCSDTSAVGVLTVINNVGINEVSQGNLFSVYPNPAQDIINLKVNVKLLGSAYSIYDKTGKLLLSGKINSENSIIEISNLSSGIYIFSFGENLNQTFNVIKE